jgi:hypothetical protein
MQLLKILSASFLLASLLSGCATAHGQSQTPNRHRLGSAVYVPTGNVQGNTLQFPANSNASTITQATPASGAGTSLQVNSQNAAVGSGLAGGDLFLLSGNADGAGNHGSVWFGDQGLANFVRVIPRVGSTGQMNFTSGSNGLNFLTTGPVTFSSTGIGGPSGTPLAFTPVTITTPTTGTLTLSAAQIAASRLRLSMTLTGALTIVFPNQLGSWRVSLSGVTFGGFTIAFKSGSTTSATVASITTTTQLVDVETYGSNTIDVGTL